MRSAHKQFCFDQTGKQLGFDHSRRLCLLVTIGLFGGGISGLTPKAARNRIVSESDGRFLRCRIIVMLYTELTMRHLRFWLLSQSSSDL